MGILVFLALVWAIYPPALPWVAGAVVFLYVAWYGTDIVHTRYMQWASDRELMREWKKKNPRSAG